VPPPLSWLARLVLFPIKDRDEYECVALHLSLLPACALALCLVVGLSSVFLFASCSWCAGRRWSASRSSSEME
jgi:hypothetical protein